MEREDLIGQKFNKLTVIGLSHYNGGPYWNCLCDCGNTKIVRGYRLKSGQTKSCGCLKIEAALEKLIGLNDGRFGRLTVIEFVETRNSNAYYRCICDCGKERIVSSYALRSGGTKSCGCYARDVASQVNKKHGLYKTKEYSSWNAMMQRCYSQKQDNYSNYGGRGINVCEKWHNVENFYADMGERPVGTSLDRIDVNGNYEPGNCRWSTDIEQHNNTNRNVTITHNEETKTIAEWATQMGVNYTKIYKRLKRGYDIKDVLFAGEFKRSAALSKINHSR